MKRRTLLSGLAAVCAAFLGAHKYRPAEPPMPKMATGNPYMPNSVEDRYWEAQWAISEYWEAQWQISEYEQDKADMANHRRAMEAMKAKPHLSQAEWDKIYSDFA